MSIDTSSPNPSWDFYGGNVSKVWGISSPGYKLTFVLLFTPHPGRRGIIIKVFSYKMRSDSSYDSWIVLHAVRSFDHYLDWDTMRF